MLSAYSSGAFAFSFGTMTMFLIPLRARELGVSLELIGILIGAGALLPMFTSIPAGAVADRIGSRHTYLLGTIIAGVVAFLFFLTSSFWEMLALHFIAGLGRGMGWVSSQTYITSIGAGDERPAIAGRFGFSVNLGTLLAPLAIGVAAQLVGYRYSFLLVAAIAAGFTAIGLTLPDVRAQAPGMARSGGSSTGFGEALKLLRLRGIQVAMLLTFVRIWVTGGWMSFYPLILVEEGFQPAMVGVIIASVSVVATGTSLLAGRASRYATKETVTAVSLMLGVFGMAISSQVLAMPLVFISPILVGVASGLGLPLLLAIFSEGAPPEQRGIVLGMRTAVNQAAGTVTPVVMGGLLTVVGVALGFAFSAAFCGTALALTLWLHVIHRRKVAAQR
jgi:MFS family permease